MQLMSPGTSRNPHQEYESGDDNPRRQRRAGWHKSLSTPHAVGQQPPVWGWQQCLCRASPSSSSQECGAQSWCKAALRMGPAPSAMLTTNSWTTPLLHRVIVFTELSLLQPWGTGKLPWPFVTKEKEWDLMNQNTEFGIQTVNNLGNLTMIFCPCYGALKIIYLFIFNVCASYYVFLSQRWYKS